MDLFVNEEPTHQEKIMAEQNQKNANAEQDLNQILKLRRQKLADLQAAGKDPFKITK